MSIPLGKSVTQPCTYSPQSLSPIARSMGRDLLPQHVITEMAGYDLWTCWECHWLNRKGIPQQAVIQITIAAHSPNIVESKSLKLYLNSLNNHRVGDKDDLLRLLEKDLTPVLQAQPTLRTLNDSDLQRKSLVGECVDTYRSQISTLYTYHERLKAIQTSVRYPQQSNNPNASYYSELFRSLCPVTAQPDFASVYAHQIAICPSALLSYWLSFRNHQSFHEQCIEQMFCDFSAHLEKEGKDNTQLKLGGAFTRRGGIDIHPIRYHQTNTHQELDKMAYTLRQ